MMNFNDILINVLRQNGLDRFCGDDMIRLFSEFTEEVITK